MICVDGEPTFINPNPTVNLGYEKPAKKPKRKLCRQKLSVSRSQTTIENFSVTCNHQYCSGIEPCQACIDKNTVIFSVANEIAKLNEEKAKLKEDVDQLCEKVSEMKLKQKYRKHFSAAYIKYDFKMRFHTGIQSLAVIGALFTLIKPHVCKMVFWRGRKVISTTLRKKHRHISHRMGYNF